MGVFLSLPAVPLVGFVASVAILVLAGLGKLRPIQLPWSLVAIVLMISFEPRLSPGR